MRGRLTGPVPGVEGANLYGEAESGEKPPSVPALKRLAAMAATALEIVLLKRRLGRL